MATRGGHVAKTRAQRQRYVENVIKGQDFSPTVATNLAESDSATDSPTPPDDDDVATEPTRARSSRDPGIFEKHKSEFVKVVIGIMVTSFLAVAGWTLKDLNREVGKLQQASEDTSRQLNDMRGNAIRSEDRLGNELRRQQSALDTLRDRIDDLRERFFSGGSRRQSKQN